MAQENFTRICDWNEEDDDLSSEKVLKFIKTTAATPEKAPRQWSNHLDQENEELERYVGLLNRQLDPQEDSEASNAEPAEEKINGGASTATINGTDEALNGKKKKRKKNAKGSTFGSTKKANGASNVKTVNGGVSTSKAQVRHLALG